MSDPDADPVDRAYAQAEATLDDEGARAARRRRVLAAVSAEAQTSPFSVPSKRRPVFTWARGGWLTAACVAALAILIQVGVHPPSGGRSELAPSTRPRAAPQNTPIAAAPEPSAPASSLSAAAPKERFRIADAAPAPTPLQAQPPLETLRSRSEAEAPAATPDALDRSSLAAAARTQTRATPAAAAPLDVVLLGERLRAAAGAGRVEEVEALLGLGAPVDAGDAAGETPLMKAVQAKRVSSAAVLRRHGADLDLKNNAGASARDMATSMRDPVLDRALDLNP